jgi:hypothetical protein
LRAAVSIAVYTALVLGCRPPRLQGTPDASPPPPPRCGDGIVDPGEQCDGTALDGGSCVALGFNYGTLSCNSDCTYNTSQCVKLCGNGKLDPGEQCDGKLGDLTCNTWGFKTCTPLCTIDATQCVTTAYAPGVPLQIDPGGFSTLAAVPPGPTASLVQAVPSFQRLDVYGYDLAQGFVQSRRLFEGGTPLLPAAADVNGDGFLDLAAINVDGTVDRYTYAPGSDTFPLMTVYPDAGACPAYAWVGAWRAGDAGPQTLLALACAAGTPPAGALLTLPGGSPAPAAFLATDGGATAAAVANFNGDAGPELVLAVDGGVSVASAFYALPFAATSVAAADFDGDGNVDLVASDGASVFIFQNVDGGFVQQHSYLGSPVGLSAVDLDLDGAPDVVWLDAAGVHVRRNEGLFSFGLFDFPMDGGVPLSLSIGDVDGTGSPDLAATFSLGGTATLTRVLINNVK